MNFLSCANYWIRAHTDRPCDVWLMSRWWCSRPCGGHHETSFARRGLLYYNWGGTCNEAKRKRRSVRLRSESRIVKEDWADPAIDGCHVCVAWATEGSWIGGYTIHRWMFWVLTVVWFWARSGLDLIRNLEGWPYHWPDRLTKLLSTEWEARGERGGKKKLMIKQTEGQIAGWEVIWYQ